MALSLWLGVVFAVSVAVRIARYSATRRYHGGRPRPRRQPDRRHPRRLCHRPALRHPHLPARLSSSGRAPDHAPARRRRRARRLLRDLAPDHRRDLAILSRSSTSTSTVSSRRSRNHRRTGFHLEFFAAILCAEVPAPGAGQLSAARESSPLLPPGKMPSARPLSWAAIYATTLFAVAIPLKIWNNTRNEKKLEEQDAPARRSTPGRPHQPDQSALSVQYPELCFVSDSHRSEPGPCHGSEAFQSACAACSANMRTSVRCETS